ncbi:MAG: hypothetical protein U0800_03880 [Isosphaeraceae bacterium]
MLQGPLDVTVHLAFAFDIGYEIDLTRARGLLPGETGPLARRRRTPESLRYRPEPLRVPLDATGLALPGGFAGGPPHAELALFDFGAASLAARFRLRIEPDELLRLAGELAEPAPMTGVARLVLAPWLERIRSVVAGFDVSDLSEEYILFQVLDTRSDWLPDHAPWIAGLVRLEPSPLSRAEVDEATRLSLSYAPDDLVVLDWAAGFVADRDCNDVLQVIEFANVQLLEFRQIDDRLDDRLETAYSQIRNRKQRSWGTFWSLPNDALRNVRELELEATSLFERADNALKLIGDQYLSRVYGMASARFHLDEWQQSILRKLKTVGDVFDLLVQQAGVRRTELLEYVVIVLIAVEVLMAFIRH